MRRRVAIIVGILVVAALAIGGPLLISITEKPVPEQAQPPLDAASTSAKHFLDRYVEPDGRVVRRDQGGDTVSEGQAYAMLISVATSDRARFDLTWTWAKNNLRQPNGLLAWNWKNGKIVDPQPATDADLDAARALAVAARQFNAPSYAAEAKTLSASILQNETISLPNGSPVLLAGPWATAVPYYTNPSYHSPRTFDELYTLTGDNRWRALNDAERNRTVKLISPSSSAVRLPPDWAHVDTVGTVTPAPAPSNTSATPEYSYDAVRLPVRLAESCNAEDRQQAATIFSIVNRSPAARASARLSLDGKVLDTNATAVGAVATAAGAKAAKDKNQVTTLLTQAAQLESTNSTYYGAAWAALGRIMLTTTWLGSC